MSRTGGMSILICGLALSAAVHAADPVSDRERRLPASVTLQREAKGRPTVAQDFAIAQSLTEEASSSAAALEEARTRVGRVLEQDARNVPARMLAGRIALLGKDPALAASHFRVAASAKPVNPAALLGLGQSLEAAGDSAGAAAAFAEYRRAVGLKPLQDPAASVSSVSESAQKK